MPWMAVPSDSAEAPKTNTQFLFSSLKAFRKVFVEGSHPRLVVDELFQRIMEGVLERSRGALLTRTLNEDTRRILDVLLDLISTFGDNMSTGQVEVVSHSPSCHLHLPFV
jgi:hypothetical protein